MPKRSYLRFLFLALIRKITPAIEDILQIVRTIKHFEYIQRKYKIMHKNKTTFALFVFLLIPFILLEKLDKHNSGKSSPNQGLLYNCSLTVERFYTYCEQCVIRRLGYIYRSVMLHKGLSGVHRTTFQPLAVMAWDSVKDRIFASHMELSLQMNPFMVLK